LFVAGKKSWLDVMNSARELTQAEIGLSDVNALIASSQSRLRVYLADFDWFERPNAGAP
jgi:adhesin transport system outer membrane protein